jgi:S-DNA-T family DNA segregation ATPase FtsK/SpoIIIE
VHGAFVSELEVQRVVEFLSRQGKPEYDKSILTTPPAATEQAGEEDYDELWDDALKIVSDTRQASISMIQRRLRVGYNRAARMIERMEQEGIVGPSDGSGKPREVLISKIE